MTTIKQKSPPEVMEDVLRFRVPSVLKLRFEAIAERRGDNPSALARKVFTSFVAKRDRTSKPA